MNPAPRDTRAVPGSRRNRTVGTDACNFTLFYVDDSGSEASGYATFTWIGLSPVNWAEATEAWLRFRADIHARYGLPASTRLHATDLADGRGRSTQRLTEPGRETGLRLIREALEVIAALPGVRLGTVYRHTSRRGRDFERHKQDLYARMVDDLNCSLRRAGDFGTIIMDGDGSNASYAQGHRRLAAVDRHLIEDPFFRHASVSQWVQIADLAAWTAYRALRPDARRNAITSWYGELLKALDINGGPVEL